MEVLGIGMVGWLELKLLVSLFPIYCRECLSCTFNLLISDLFTALHYNFFTFFHLFPFYLSCFHSSLFPSIDYMFRTIILSVI